MRIYAPQLRVTPSRQTRRNSPTLPATRAVQECVIQPGCARHGSGGRCRALIREKRVHDCRRLEPHRHVVRPRGSLSRATDYARAQGHAEVTLEHMLLALCDDPDAVLVLAASNIDVARAEGGRGGQLAALPTRGAAWPDVDPVVSPDLRRILEAAAAAARGGRRREINGAIVLAAIVGDGKSAAAHMLRSAGTDVRGRDPRAAERARAGASAPAGSRRRATFSPARASACNRAPGADARGCRWTAGSCTRRPASRPIAAPASEARRRAALRRTPSASIATRLSLHAEAASSAQHSLRAGARGSEPSRSMSRDAGIEPNRVRAGASSRGSAFDPRSLRRRARAAADAGLGAVSAAASACPTRTDSWTPPPSPPPLRSTLAAPPSGTGPATVRAVGTRRCRCPGRGRRRSLRWPDVAASARPRASAPASSDRPRAYDALAPEQSRSRLAASLPPQAAPPAPSAAVGAPGARRARRDRPAGREHPAHHARRRAGARSRCASPGPTCRRWPRACRAAAPPISTR